MVGTVPGAYGLTVTPDDDERGQPQREGVDDEPQEESHGTMMAGRRPVVSASREEFPRRNAAAGKLGL